MKNVELHFYISDTCNLPNPIQYSRWKYLRNHFLPVFCIVVTESLHLVNSHLSGLTALCGTAKFCPTTLCLSLYEVLLISSLCILVIFSPSYAAVKACQSWKRTSMHTPLLLPVSRSQRDKLVLSFVPALALISSLGELIQPAAREERAVCSISLQRALKLREGRQWQDTAGCGGMERVTEPGSPSWWQ